jgi:uncharacterized protein (DUF2147 family)
MNRQAMGSALLLLVLLSSSSSGHQAPIFGRWRTGDGKAIVSIERCGPHACGRIDTVLDRSAPKTDVNNPDRALHDKPLIGTEVLSGFAPDGDKWQGGRAYDPKSGRSYDARMTVVADGRLAITGCILFLCKTQHWTRVTPGGH